MPWPYALAHTVFRGEALLPPFALHEDGSSSGCVAPTVLQGCSLISRSPPRSKIVGLTRARCAADRTLDIPLMRFAPSAALFSTTAPTVISSMPEQLIPQHARTEYAAERAAALERDHRRQ